MDFIKLIIQILASVSVCLVALLSILLFIRLKWPAPMLWIIKLYVSALSPVFVFIGVLSFIAGLTTGSIFIRVISIYIVLIFCTHIIRVTRAPDFKSSFRKAFGLDWANQRNAEQKNYFLPDRAILRLPVVPNPRFEQNITFATIPGTDRKLLCDIWRPPTNVIPSGVAFIYLHGSAWYFLDKDIGTRKFFRHLSAQGHVIMDVAYRLSPETDMLGMVNDVKRAISWMKENADTYGIKPNRIVVGGGSAGGHLALMAAFTANNPEFTPKELEGIDLNVAGVISQYGPTDLEAMYYHTNQHLTTRSTPGKPKKAVPTQMPQWMINRMGKEYYRLNFDKGFVNAGAFAPLLGGHPDEIPDTYDFFSPIHHVHSKCPPTLLIHGEHDLMAPVKTTRLLHARLEEENVQSVIHIIPQSDHAFDLILPGISPSAHSAYFDVERFLTILTSPSSVQYAPDSALHAL